LRAEHRLEVTTGAPAVGLCLIKREIGICDQIIDASAVIGSDCNARAAAEMQRVIADVEGLRELLEHCVDHLTDPAGVPAIRHDQHEFIPAEAEHLSGLAVAFADFDQSMADLGEQLIADRVPQRIVHVLEIVEIEDRKPRGAAASSARQPPAQLLLEREPVGQSCQRVVMGKPLELLLGAHLIGNIFNRPGDATYRAIAIAHWSGSDSDLHRCSVLAHPFHLRVPDRLTGERTAK